MVSKAVLTFFGGLFAACLIIIPIFAETNTQKERVNYCNSVLVPETCRVLVERDGYATALDCSQALNKEGFCAEPIKSTIHDMSACVLKLHNSTSLQDCLDLHH